VVSIRPGWSFIDRQGTRKAPGTLHSVYLFLFPACRSFLFLLPFASHLYNQTTFPVNRLRASTDTTMQLLSLPFLSGALALLVGGAQANDCLEVALAAIPVCAQGCYLEGAPTIGCDGLDFACQCDKQAAMFAAIESCVVAACKEVEFSAVIDGAAQGKFSFPFLFFFFFFFFKKKKKISSRSTYLVSSSMFHAHSFNVTCLLGKQTCNTCTDQFQSASVPAPQALSAP